MRTINSLLEYNLSDSQKQALKSAWIINWVWWEWQNIESTILALFELIPWYNHDKATKLLSDIRECSVEHDIQYFFCMWFHSANFKFARKLYHLTHWWKAKRIFVFLWVLYTLTVYGKPFYYGSEK